MEVKDSGATRDPNDRRQYLSSERLLLPTRITLRQTRQLDLNPDERGTVGVFVFLLLIGVDQARRIIVRCLHDRLDKGVIVRHEAAPSFAVKYSRTTDVCNGRVRSCGPVIRAGQFSAAGPRHTPSPVR